MSVRLPSSPSDVFLSVVLVGCQVLSIPLAMIRRAILWRRRPLLVWLSAPPHRVRPASALRLQDLLADRHGRGRVLARWAAAEQFALVFAHRRWARWAGPAHRAAVPSGIRRTTAELVRGRRVAVIIDDFVARGGCEVDFLDHRTRVAMRATWIAAQARVPVVPVTIYYRSG